MKFSILLMAIALSATHAQADCTEDYEKAFQDSLNYYGWDSYTRSKKSLRRAKEFTYDSLGFPGVVAGATYEFTRIHSAMTPFAFLSGGIAGLATIPVSLPFTGLTLVPLAGFKMNERIKYRRIPKFIRIEMKAVQLMRELKNLYTPSHFARAFLDNDYIKNEYPSNQAAYADLRKAYSNGFFCKKDENGNVTVMSYREIKRSIRDGSLKQFCHDL